MARVIELSVGLDAVHSSAEWRTVEFSHVLQPADSGLGTWGRRIGEY